MSTLTSAWISRHKAVFYRQGPQWQVKFRQIVRSGEHGPEKRDPAPALTPLCSPAVVTCHPAQRPAPPPPPRPPPCRPDPPRPHWLPPAVAGEGRPARGQRRPVKARGGWRKDRSRPRCWALLQWRPEASWAMRRRSLVAPRPEASTRAAAAEGAISRDLLPL